MNCDELRFPTNDEDSFYTQLVDNAKNYDTTFTQEDQTRKALLNQAFLECFNRRFPDNNEITDDYINDL